MDLHLPVVLRGAFLPISGMTFQGQSEKKGKELMANLFNVEERQEKEKNTVIQARMLRTTNISDPPYFLHFELDINRSVQ